MTTENPPPKIYFISGLGADWRMFQFLKLPPGLSYEHIAWISPLSVREPLKAYVLRLKEKITDPHPILIGLSFGGVVAIELAKLLKPRKLILISSLSHSSALPWYYRALGKLQLHRHLPLPLMQAVLPLAPYFFGAHTATEKMLLRQAILDIDETYLRWALEQLLTWRQKEPLPDLIHLHGTHDKILPLRQLPGMYLIEGGEHLMVMHHASEISAILEQILKDI